MQIQQLGPYRIGRKLGKGGMGSVYEAVDEKTGQRVAVKALTPQLAQAEGFRERFESEIESLKKLQHEGIVRLLGYGEHDGVLFYSMELVEGPSLEQEINAGRRFDWRETLTLAVQVCRALKHAHDHGVVHRDIKPANLLLAEDNRLKIADFGIARLFGSTQLTSAGGVLGTADYMSPEQADGRAVTDKCDQYSLGCVMYALLAGRPPFHAKTMPEMLQLQRFAEPESVRRYAPQTPEQLDRLIRQLLSKEPAERFPNVLVLGRHMEAMLKGLSRPGQPDAKGNGAEAAGPQARLESTAVFNADATLAPEDLAIAPSETTDSGVYNAPTLADDGQIVEQPAADGQAASVVTTAPPKTVAPPRESRFTTVDEDARRRSQEQQAHRWVVALQLAGWAAMLAALGGLGWWLTRPASADAVYNAIKEHVDEKREDLDPVADEIGDFLQRFPTDPRAEQVRQYADELDLQKLERQARLRARVTDQRAIHPIADVFREAAQLQEIDPVRAAKLLENLLALYPGSAEAAPGLNDDQRKYLTLARRKLAELRSQIEKQAAEQFPVLRDRLAAARRLERSAPQQAAAMYRAMIELYGEQPWAASIIDEARARLQALEPSK